VTGPLSLKSDVDVAQGGGFLCEGHNADVNAVVLAKNGALASGSDDHSIKVWHPTDSHTWECVHTDGRQQQVVYSMAALSDGRIAIGTDKGHVRLHKPNPAGSGWGVDRAQSEYEPVNRSKVTSLAEMADGRLIVCQNDTIRIWDLNSGKNTDLYGHTKTVWRAIQCSDGRIVSCGSDGQIRFWG